MMFVLPVGIRSPLRISAMISNLLRFLSKAFLVISMLYYLLDEGRPFPKQTLL
jgi:predicted PurR-regulated permease PerM